LAPDAIQSRTGHERRSAFATGLEPGVRRQIEVRLFRSGLMATGAVLVEDRPDIAQVAGIVGMQEWDCHQAGREPDPAHALILRPTEFAEAAKNLNAMAASASRGPFDFLRKLEAPPGFEPGVEVLQISLGSVSC